MICVKAVLPVRRFSLSRIKFILGPITFITLMRHSVLFQDFHDEPVPHFVRHPDGIQILFGYSHRYAAVDYPV